MSYAKRQKHRDCNPLAKIYNLKKGFAMLPIEIIKSPAYRDLSPSAAKCLPMFIFKYSHESQNNGNFDGSVVFTYGEAQSLGLTRQTFSNAVKDLEARGFIEITKHGGLRGVHGTCSRYTLSRRFKEYEPKTPMQSPEIDDDRNKDAA